MSRFNHVLFSLIILGQGVCSGQILETTHETTPQAKGTAATASVIVPQLNETAAQREARIKWFRDAKFGLFIHWGPAAISGEEISWGMDGRIEGGAHHKKVPRETYMNLYKQFDPVKFDAEKILGLASKAGMKYFVFVTKHHDGFCLWPTKEKRFGKDADYPPTYSIADTPYQGDPVRMMQQAAIKQNMKIGWYYSTRDWTHPEYLKGDQPSDNAAYNQYYENQVQELLTEYGPVDIMWFDHCFGQWDQYTVPTLFEKMYTIDPNLLVNNRAAKGLKNVPKQFLPLLKGDFDTPENRMGAFQYGRAWESCMILSPHEHGGWSYRPEGVTRSLTETIQLLSSCVTGDGNMLLNLAPLPDGSLRPEEQAILEGLAPWIEKHKEAIYGTRGGPWINGTWGGSTHNGADVYLHLFNPTDQPIVLNTLPQKVTAATLLNGTEVLYSYSEDGQELSITLPPEHHDPHVTIIKLTLDSEVTGVLYGSALANEEENQVPGTLDFSPRDAKLIGKTISLKKKKDFQTIGNWTDVTNTVQWDLNIDSPGTYRVLMTSSAEKSGSRVSIGVRGKKMFHPHIPGTGSEDNFQTYEVGKLTFNNSEELKLIVRPVGQEAWTPIEIKSIKLVPEN